MKILKFAALFSLTVALVAGMTIAPAEACTGDKAAKATTAKAEMTEKVEATTASATAVKKSCASKAEKATASMASTTKKSCASKAETATASMASTKKNCASKATTATASLASSGKASCSSKTATASFAKMPEVKTVRISNNTLAVLYSGTCAGSNAAVKTAFSNKEDCPCPVTADMMKNEACTVEMIEVPSGILVLVTSDEAQVVDEYEAQYDVAMSN